jgi:hypothetical protein
LLEARSLSDALVVTGAIAAPSPFATHARTL